MCERTIEERLLEVLTIGQIEDFLVALTLLKTAQFGEVRITFKNGHPHTIQPAPEFLLRDEDARGREWMRHMQDAIHAGE